ncbi:MAG: GtrA family protein [Akkermansia sp.]|nr:GtrA family protein [Akkermansia sp.]
MRLAEKYSAQFARFFIVGVGATIVHWGCYAGVNRLFGLTESNQVALNLSYAFGYIVSFLGNYAASLRWTFRTSGSLSKGAGFAFSHVINATLHFLLLNLFIRIGMGSFLASGIVCYTPWLAEHFPILTSPDTLLPLPVFVIAVPINFLMVRFFLTRGDEKKA